MSFQTCRLISSKEFQDVTKAETAFLLLTKRLTFANMSGRCFRLEMLFKEMKLQREQPLSALRTALFLFSPPHLLCVIIFHFVLCFVR